ncbi:MAG: hypothetical protein VX152_12270, partial [Pseudomonadota bacterium]|nr:hypothetical protein [Pseudomonadota bacterium]
MLQAENERLAAALAQQAVAPIEPAAGVGGPSPSALAQQTEQLRAERDALREALAELSASVSSSKCAQADGSDGVLWWSASLGVLERSDRKRDGKRAR